MLIEFNFSGFHLSTGASTTAGPSPASIPANPCNDKRSSLNTEISIDMTKRPASKGGFSRIARLVGSGKHDLFWFITKNIICSGDQEIGEFYSSSFH